MIKMEDVFKACPGCGKAWRSREDFLSDPELELIGYQVDMENPLGGFFLFNHACEDTLALPASCFLDLVDRPLQRPSLYGTTACAGHCLHRSDLDPCRSICECAYVRDVLQVVRHWPKPEKPGQSGK
jgi:hypothetical protein